MNTFSKKILAFFSTLMWVGLLYVAVLMFIGHTSTNTYQKDSNNVVQKVMADLNFFQSKRWTVDKEEHPAYQYNDPKLYNEYSSSNYPLPELYNEVVITQDTVDPKDIIPGVIILDPPPVTYSH